MNSPSNEGDEVALRPDTRQLFHSPKHPFHKFSLTVTPLKQICHTPSSLPEQSLRFPYHSFLSPTPSTKLNFSVSHPIPGTPHRFPIPQKPFIHNFNASETNASRSESERAPPPTRRASSSPMFPLSREESHHLWPRWAFHHHRLFTKAFPRTAQALAPPSRSRGHSTSTSRIGSNRPETSHVTISSGVDFTPPAQASAAETELKTEQLPISAPTLHIDHLR
jgi:hypothetical protein